MYINQLSKELGIPLPEIIKRCAMFRMNHTYRISEENVNTLSYYVKYEGKSKFEVRPSKINQK